MARERLWVWQRNVKKIVRVRQPRYLQVYNGTQLSPARKPKKLHSFWTILHFMISIIDAQCYRGVWPICCVQWKVSTFQCWWMGVFSRSDFLVVDQNCVQSQTWCVTGCLVPLPTLSNQDRECHKEVVLSGCHLAKWVKRASHVQRLSHGPFCAVAPGTSPGLGSFAECHSPSLSAWLPSLLVVPWFAVHSSHSLIQTHVATRTVLDPHIILHDSCCCTVSRHLNPIFTIFPTIFIPCAGIAEERILKTSFLDI